MGERQMLPRHTKHKRSITLHRLISNVHGAKQPVNGQARTKTAQNDEAQEGAGAGDDN
jgi:hypothetical protein